MISKLSIEQQVSWLSSHAAGVMKAHALDERQEDFWQTVLNVTNEIAALRRKVADAEQVFRVLDRTEDAT